jgi:hypothetical protein
MMQLRLKRTGEEITIEQNLTLIIELLRRKNATGKKYYLF